MMLILKPEDINKYNFFFSNKIPNNIYENSYFIKIKFSNDSFTLNNIYIKFSLYITKCCTSFNKEKYYFDPLKNSEIIFKLCNIENNILNTYYSEKKLMKIYKLLDQLNNGYIKIYNDINKIINTNSKNINILLKISGIWQTNNAIGLTYKFILMK